MRLSLNLMNMDNSLNDTIQNSVYTQHPSQSISKFNIVSMVQAEWFCKSLNSRKSFVLGELSFARMPSRHYCLKMNKVHCWNWRPELVNCGQWQPSGVVTQHGITQILGLPKLLQKLIPPHICWKLDISKKPKFFGHPCWVTTPYGYHWLQWTNFWQTISKLNFIHFHTITTQRHPGKRNFSQNKWFKSHFRMNLSKFSHPIAGMKVRLNSLLYLPISHSWHFVNINPNP